MKGQSTARLKVKAGSRLCSWLGFGRDRRIAVAILEVIDLGFAADKRPQQPHGIFQRQPGRGVAPVALSFKRLRTRSGPASALRSRHRSIALTLRVKAEINTFDNARVYVNGDPGQACLNPFDKSN